MQPDDDRVQEDGGWDPLTLNREKPFTSGLNFTSRVVAASTGTAARSAAIASKYYNAAIILNSAPSTVVEVRIDLSAVAVAATVTATSCLRIAKLISEVELSRTSGCFSAAAILTCFSLPLWSRRTGPLASSLDKPLTKANAPTLASAIDESYVSGTKILY